MSHSESKPASPPTTCDPVGPRNRLRDNVFDFTELPACNGWTLCFYSVTPQVRTITDSIGWNGVRVGEETGRPDAHRKAIPGRAHLAQSR